MPVMSLRVLPLLLTLAPGAAGLAPSSGAAAGGPPLAVELLRVEQGPLTFDVSLTGTIVAQDGSAMSFPQGGRVTEVLVEGRRLGLEAGDAQLLRRYEGWRSLDTFMVAAATDTLTRLFGVPGKAASAVRR